MAVAILHPSTSMFSKSRERFLCSLWSLLLVPSCFPNVFVYEFVELVFSYAFIF